jgi:hypothetical protein
MVRTERLELSHLAALEPKSSVSTNSTTSACWPLRTEGLRRVQIEAAHYSHMRSRLSVAVAGICRFDLLLQAQHRLVHLHTEGINGFNSLFHADQPVTETA